MEPKPPEPSTFAPCSRKEAELMDSQSEESSYWGLPSTVDSKSDIVDCPSERCESPERDRNEEGEIKCKRLKYSDNEKTNDGVNAIALAGAIVDEIEPDSNLPSKKLVRENDSKEEETFEPVMIKAIDKNVVHQICSGQVIVTLSTAVKELVENAIDAGATSVEIRLVQYGSSVIEVIDNGNGVDESNLEGLALKHHTSKISQFEDLASVSTFGFRGEALSSLCSLSSLSVVTRSKGDAKVKTGFKVDYDSNGKILSKTACARECGTSVILRNLFSPLPVRHREFVKNLKKEFNKMINVLYGYGLIARGVRLTCTNQVENGALNKVISVPPYKSIRERIAAIFGSKQVASLMEFLPEKDIPEETLAEFGLTEKTFIDKYLIEGFISVPNSGRSSNDRQFYFINSRPCDPSKINRVVNEVFHGYSRSQSPFVCLNIKTQQENVDVNVTPDKRVLYLQSEKSLYAFLKASLISMYSSESSKFNVSGKETLTFTQTQLSQPVKKVKGDQNTSTFSSPSSFYKARQSYDEGSTFARQFSSKRCEATSFPSSSPSTRSISRASSFLQAFAHKSHTLGGGSGLSSVEKSAFDKPYSRNRPSFKEIAPKESSNILDELLHLQPNSWEDDDEELAGKYALTRGQNSPLHVESFEVNSDDDDCVILYDDELPEIVPKGKRVESHINLDWDKLRIRINENAELSKRDSVKTVNYARRFRAQINPGENDAAEQELKKQLTKDMFSKMALIGQFNLGFILGKIGPDLFIVDQHASDEKYNFEDLEKSTIMQQQVLIRPMDLQLPAISENVILENIEVFQRNGFDFDINLEGELSEKVKLTKIPFSKSCEFGKTDVDELIFMLEDAPEKSFCRPSKVRQMFASRACRKSVMIGTALGFNEMRKIVNHMGEMDQPWNCPHGRPTIRHLMNLNLLPDTQTIAIPDESA